LRIQGKWLVLVAIGFGTFMTALDGSIVNTILPVIRNSFGSEVAEIEWVITVYLLIVSGLLLSFGRLGDLRGHKTIFSIGMGGFIAASAFCAAAPSAAALVAFRGVQAIGGAMMFANSPAILTKAFPGSQRGQALGTSAMLTYLGLTVGPTLGGFLADHFGWRSAFYVNLPVGAIGLTLGLRFIQSDRLSGGAEKFDLKGAAVFLTGLVSLLLALNQGHSWGWTSPAILLLVAISVAALAAFIWIENHVPAPMLDLTLFRNRLFTASVASATLNYVCVYCVLFLLPFYLIQGRGMSAGEAGLVLVVQPLVMAVVAPIAGTLSDRIGSRIPAVVGMAVLSVGLLELSRLGENSSVAQIRWALALAGLGTGTFISPNSSALLGSAPPGRQGIASAVLATARNAGMVLGVGLAGAVFTTVLASADNPSSGTLYQAIGGGFTAAFLVSLLGVVASSARGPSRNAESVRAAP
jgi:EmrB/QacA subfamily drug resistance transporter